MKKCAIKNLRRVFFPTESCSPGTIYWFEVHPVFCWLVKRRRPWGATAPKGISSYLDNGWSYGSEIFNGIVRISLLHIHFEPISAIDTLKKVMIEINFEKKLNFRKKEMCPD